eukprot:1144374-Amphidinium_carterae.1
MYCALFNEGDNEVSDSLCSNGGLAGNFRTRQQREQAREGSGSTERKEPADALPVQDIEIAARLHLGP